MSEQPTPEVSSFTLIEVLDVVLKLLWEWWLMKGHVHVGSLLLLTL